MDTTPLWKEISDSSITYPPLEKNIEVDVAIVGGGITGVTAALNLLKAGQTVAILESDRIGSGTTGFSTGNLYVAVQPYYQKLINKFDTETGKAIAHSRQYAIDYIEKIVQEHQINCQFHRRPWFLYTNDEKKLSFLEKEVETIKSFAVEIDYVDSMPLAFPFKKAAVMHNQARFNPRQYVVSLAEVLAKQGCQIFEKTHVVKYKEKEVCTLEIANGSRVIAKKILLATHTPIGFNPVQVYTAPYRSYVVGVEVKDNYYPEGHFWDIDDPHHASCTHAVKGESPEMLFVAGSHHKVGQEPNAVSHFEALEKFLREHFAVSKVAYRWSAQHYHSADDVPYIGLASHFVKNTYMATGYFADGLVYGTIAGILITDLMLEKENELNEVYKANRFKLIASMPFLMKEGANVMMQYIHRLKPAKKDDYADLKPGEGKNVEIDKEKCGVCRDEHNNVHIVSAICPHMKCLVGWNNAEKTWDCPCHGSRFTQTGKYIEGPALTGLTKK